MRKKVQNHLDPVAGHLDAILDSIEDGVFIADRDGYALKVNAAYEQLTGMAKAELIGKNVEELKKAGLFNIAPITPEIVATGRPASSIQVTRDNRSMTIDGKPVRDPDGTVSLVVLYARDITLMARMRERISRQQELIETYQHQMDFFIREGGGVTGFIAENSAMKRLMDLLRRVAATDAVALVLGETGVGKELFARMIHEASPRREKPFVKVDCASIPENLIESELFGYAPGAFTGAHPKGRVGFFEMAEGGTIFLDEIGEMPLVLQSKLLRVLQDRELTPVGSSRARRTDVRVIAATNRNLENEAKLGTFRSDLFFRLRVAVLEIPPLRDRPDDILPLARLFLQRFGSRYRKRAAFSLEAERILAHYNWPGNVRELENLIEGLVITCDGAIAADDLPTAMRVKECPLPAAGPQEPAAPGAAATGPCLPVDFERPYKEVLSAFERDYLERAIAHFGSVGEAAKRLGLDRTTIFRKMKRAAGE
ncbi:sigma-54 interaction domain-containing protein [Solidesulfovibrio sp.]|uniref:sigma-54 interaction domain-containing protein n=1 Tax=Solidesulfovibrio sp. TaxID=2910990 RepID=UPI002B215C47|nr:sigma 54-interacting transcriptional regulator [Solidesulfovibrio sp.]MEA4857510.1 sigma 54-interacting transcriptional regulator [Solidesulfovibrio sp.]